MTAGPTSGWPEQTAPRLPPFALWLKNGYGSAGNHDPKAPASCDGERREDFEIGGAILRHEPRTARDTAEIAGHFHPKASLSAGGYRFSGRCFCASDDLLLPAFGAYAGGLSCTAPAIRSLHKENPRIFMLHASKIWRVT